MRMLEACSDKLKKGIGMSKCEVKNCELYAYAPVNLFGHLTTNLCNRHLRLWQTDERVGGLTRRDCEIKHNLTFASHAIEGGHLSVEEGRTIEKNLAQQAADVKAEARAYAIDLFGFVVGDEDSRD